MPAEASGREGKVPQQVIPLRRRPRRSLTVRELHVLELMADGRQHREIARDLSASEGSFVSSESVKSIEHRLMAKLDARSPLHAVALGIRSGLIR